MHVPNNKLIVTIEKKFYDSVSLAGGGTLYIDPSWHPEEYAILSARVVAIPDNIIKRKDYEGMTIDMKVGDEILVRYDLVFDYKDQPDRDTPIYKNMMLIYDHNTGNYCEFWRCDIQKVFGIIRGEEIEMVNGYVMLDPIEERQENFSGMILRPESTRWVVRKDKAVVKAIGTVFPGQPDHAVDYGDVVYINPKAVQQYTIDRNTFYIVRQSHLLAAAV